MKVPEPRKLKSGNYFVRLRLGGESIPITAPTATEARRQAALVKSEYLNGKRASFTSQKTLGQLIDDYINKYRAALSPSTVRGYLQCRKLRFPDYMDRLPSRINYQRMINDELARGLSLKTVRNGWGCVTAALNDVKIPFPAVKFPAPVPHETAFLEPEDIPAFLSAIRGDKCELEMLLGLHSLRSSEIMAVVRNKQWDLDAIKVRGALVRSPDHTFAARENNKSRAGTRTVPIMIPRLRELLEDPKPHSPQTVNRHIAAACDKAGLAHVTQHGLRHTFASLAFSLGMSEALCQELGGWDDPGTMHRIYVHLTQRERTKAQNAMANFYQNVNENVNDF